MMGLISIKYQVNDGPSFLLKAWWIMDPHFINDQVNDGL